MNDPRLDYELRRHNAIRERLLAEEEDIDERTLADTVEGLTDLHELLAAIVRGALEDEALVAALKIRLADMADRMRRLSNRADRRRHLVRDVMLDGDVKKIAEPDFTATLRPAPPSVVIVDEKQIPQTFIEMRPHVRKRELLDALKDGTQIEGAALSNPGMSLAVRTK